MASEAVPAMGGTEANARGQRFSSTQPGVKMTTGGQECKAIKVAINVVGGSNASHGKAINGRQRDSAAQWAEGRGRSRMEMLFLPGIHHPAKHTSCHTDKNRYSGTGHVALLLGTAQLTGCRNGIRREAVTRQAGTSKPAEYHARREGQRGT